MQVLKDLTRKQLIAIFTILVIVSTSLYVWELWDNQRQNKLQTSEYQRLEEENQLLQYEIQNLTKQNELLHEVIGLKRRLE